MIAHLRPARSTDAGRVGEILHAFALENDWMPKLHSAAETIAFCGTMIDRGWVTVAETETGVIGFLARHGDEIHSLYLNAAVRGQGIGQQLLQQAQAAQSPLALNAFQANDRACRFYERNGFVEVSRSDGAGNDENLPDIRYVWNRQEAGNG